MPLEQSPRTAFFAAAITTAVLLTGCGNDAPDDAAGHPSAGHVVKIATVEDALAAVHVPSVDPTTMVDAQIGEAIGEGPRCEFRYTSSGKPVLGVAMQSDGRPAAGVVNLKTHLVLLKAEPSAEGMPLTLAAGPLRLTVESDPDESATRRGGYEHRSANLVMEIAERMRVGYRGYLDCGANPPFRLPRR